MDCAGQEGAEWNSAVEIFGGQSKQGCIAEMLLAGVQGRWGGETLACNFPGHFCHLKYSHFDTGKLDNKSILIEKFQVSNTL